MKQTTRARHSVIVVCTVVTVASVLAYCERQQAMQYFTDSVVLKNVSHESENIYWQHYQLGDIVYKCGRYKYNIELADEKKSRQYVCRNWVACLYKLDNTSSSSIEKLTRICETASHSGSKSIPQNIDVIMHILLGDTMTKHNCWEVFCDSKVFPITYYTQLAQTFPAGTRIVFVGWPHHLPHFSDNTALAQYSHSETTQSLVYMQKLSLLLQELKFIVETQQNHVPDDDFIYMCNAHYFVKGAGGFSDLIAAVVQARKGHVITIT